MTTPNTPGNFSFDAGDPCCPKTRADLQQSIAEQTATINATLASIVGKIVDVAQTSQTSIDSAKQSVINQIVSSVTPSITCYNSCTQSLTQSLANLTSQTAEIVAGQVNIVLPEVKWLPEIKKWFVQLPDGEHLYVDLPPPPAGEPPQPPGVAIFPPIGGAEFLQPIQPQGQPIQPLPIVPLADIPPTAGGAGGAPQWIGYCRKADGNVIALPENQPPPGPEYEAICKRPTREAAVRCAREKCPQPPTIGPAELVSPQPYDAVGPIIGCDLAIFGSKNRIAELFSREQEIANWTAIVDAERKIVEGVVAGMDDLPIGGAISRLIKAGIDSPLTIAQVVVPILSGLLGCDDETFKTVAGQLSLLGYWEKYAGMDVGPFKRIYDYSLNALCRQRHLEPDKAMAAFLGNSIDRTQLETYWAIAGYCPEALEQYYNAARSKPIPPQLAEFRRRGIYSVEKYHEGMRELGYDDRKIAEDIFQSECELPPVQDIVRFMVRDTDDQEIVDSLEMDALFDHKFGPKLKEWSKQRGIPEEMMKHEWRAHWTIPGPGQLFEFWHRLRRNPAFGTPEEQRKDIERALIHNDILPHWFDKFFAVQYRPLPFRQVRQIYEIGGLTDDELELQFTYNGFSDDVSQQLVKAYHKIKVKNGGKSLPVHLWLAFAINGDECIQRLTDLGYTTDDANSIMVDAEIGFDRSTIAKAFLDGELDANGLISKLTAQGVSFFGANTIVSVLAPNVKTTPEYEQFIDGTLEQDAAVAAMTAYGIADFRIEFLIARVDRSIKKQSLAACIRGIKKQFATGGIKQQQAINQLIGAGIVLTRANVLVESWQCERASKDKAVASATLCQWLDRGAITAIEFVDRMKAVGYSEPDAQELMVDCLGRLNEKQAKEAERNAKNEAAAREKAARKQQQAAAQLERQVAKLAAMRKAANAAKLRRERQLLQAADYVQKQCKCSVTEATHTVSAAREVLKNQLHLTEDQTLQVLLTAGERWKGGTPDDYYALVEATAALLISSAEPATEAYAGVG